MSVCLHGCARMCGRILGAYMDSCIQMCGVLLCMGIVLVFQNGRGGGGGGNGSGGG